MERSTSLPRLLLASLALCVTGIPCLYAQETVLNVPSADVLDRGTAYMESDSVFNNTSPLLNQTPRMVRGIGSSLEAGLNLGTFNSSGPSAITLSPTLKWRIYQNAKHGFTLFTGDNLSVPVTHRTYDLGNFVYLGAAQALPRGGRLGFGTYDFTAHVVDRANRGGIFASIEQPITARLSVQSDWFSGNHAAGYATVGATLKVRSTTWTPAFQMGNAGLTSGNHAVLLIVGWTPSWSHPRA